MQQMPLVVFVMALRGSFVVPLLVEEQECWQRGGLQESFAAPVAVKGESCQ
jgi:hypothetical protein